MSRLKRDQGNGSIQLHTARRSIFAPAEEMHIVRQLVPAQLLPERSEKPGRITQRMPRLSKRKAQGIVGRSLEMQTVETQGSKEMHGSYDVGTFVVFRVQLHLDEFQKLHEFCKSIGEPAVKIIHEQWMPAFKRVFWVQVISFLRESFEAKLKELGIEPV